MLARRGDAERFIACIDHDDATGPVLETSIEGRLALLTDAALLRAFARQPLFTFGVVARIHWQAAKLAWRRVPFVSKPARPAAEFTHQLTP
jgi:DUF1365 family protein